MGYTVVLFYSFTNGTHFHLHWGKKKNQCHEAADNERKKPELTIRCKKVRSVCCLLTSLVWQLGVLNMYTSLNLLEGISLPAHFRAGGGEVVLGELLLGTREQGEVRTGCKPYCTWERQCMTRMGGVLILLESGLDLETTLIQQKDSLHLK